MPAADPSYGQGATEIYWAQGGKELRFPSGTTLNLDSGATANINGTFVNAGSQGLGQVKFDLFNARLIASNDIPNTAAAPSGGLLTLNTAPLLKRSNAATDKSMTVQWVASSSIELQLPSLLLPSDCDVSKAITLNLLAAMGGVTDTPTVAFGLWEGIGGSNLGGNTGAVTGTTAAVYSAGVAGATLAGGTVISCMLTPGAHTTDALVLYAAWLGYIKKTT